MEDTLLTQITELLTPEMLIVVVALILIGLALKQTPKVQDWLIVWILPIVGIVFSLFLLGVHIEAVLQGILAAGAAVLIHQMWKQTKNK